MLMACRNSMVVQCYFVKKTESPTKHIGALALWFQTRTRLYKL